MLSDLEARVFSRRKGRAAQALELACLYLLIALALLAELSLVVLHPEDDGVLLIGVVLLTIAFAIWLPFLVLIPAVVGLWLLPPAIRDAVAGNQPFTWSHWAALAGQLYLANATRVAYKALRHRLGLDHPPMAPALPVAAVAPASTGPSLPAPETAAVPPALPCGRVLAVAEARSLFQRLAALSRELDRTREAIRPTLETSLNLEVEYLDHVVRG